MIVRSSRDLTEQEIADQILEKGHHLINSLDVTKDTWSQLRKLDQQMPIRLHDLWVEFWKENQEKLNQIAALSNRWKTV